MKKQQKELWKIIVGVLSLAFIAFMWIKKDVVGIYAAMPAEHALPLIVTTLAVSLLKMAALAGVILLVKWVIGRVKSGRP